jgi:hypothetical protein
MSDSGDDLSLWSESEVENLKRTKAQGKREKDVVLDAINEVEAKYAKLNERIYTLTNQAKVSLETSVDQSSLPTHLNTPIKVNGMTPVEITKSLGSASSHTAVREWAKALPQLSEAQMIGASPPRVIQMPEWIAILQLMSVQLPKLSKVADELELLGHGYYYSETDALETEAVGDWLKANVGPLDIQVYKTRISSLKEKIGSRTKVRGGEAVEVSPHLPVRYFHAHVVSVLKDDLEDISLKILASDPRTPSASVIEIGRGRNPYHIKGVGGTWSKILTAIGQLRSRTRPWIE